VCERERVREREGASERAFFYAPALETKKISIYMYTW
jgi:hypothetical protein